jgi:chemotaxis protein MotA
MEPGCLRHCVSGHHRGAAGAEPGQGAQAGAGHVPDGVQATAASALGPDQPQIESESDTFTRKGLQLLVDGSEPDAIRGVLEVELGAREHSDLAAAKVFENAGIYSPTMGIIGAVMGLMAVMQNLADPSKLGHGIAAAFVATIYGVALANLLMLPMASRLKGLVHKQTQMREILVEGLVSIAEGANPRQIEAKLQGYLS